MFQEVFCEYDVILSECKKILSIEFFLDLSVILRKILRIFVNTGPGQIDAMVLSEMCLYIMMQFDYKVKERRNLVSLV